jgi:uncharacterized membrane protein YkvA (DUF1232 family)
MSRFIEYLKARARALKREIHALYLAARDPRTPSLAKLVIAIVVAYAVSPIDLIPDFIPILGYLDDVVLLPLGIYLALKLIPAAVLSDARRAAQQADGKLPRSPVAAIVIISLWIISAVVVGAFALRLFDAK